MDPPASPPKRVTRSRAAVKASATASTEASAARSKTIAAASKPRPTRNTVVASTRRSGKRKTRADDHQDDSDIEAPAKRTLPNSGTATRPMRGGAPARSRKTVESEPEQQHKAMTVVPALAPARATRGRAPKKTVAASVTEAPAPRMTRTRAKKARLAEDGEGANDLAPEPAKRTARARPAGPVKATSAPSSKPKAAVKSVTFAEPDKENVVPRAGYKATTAASRHADAAATGMLAKPLRKPRTASRTTKTVESDGEHKEVETSATALRPKKTVQLLRAWDREVESEDELALDKTPTPVRPLHHKAVKAPVAAKPPPEHSDVGGCAADREALELGPPAPTEHTILLGSPVRRPPPSPFKDCMKTPAKRVDGLPLGLSATRERESFQPGASQHKMSLMQSPAKRCPVPIKPVDLDVPARKDQAASPFKQPLFHSLARRPFSPIKACRPSEVEPAQVGSSPALTPVLLCTPFQAPASEISGGAAEDQPRADSAAESPLPMCEDGQAKAPSLSTIGFDGRMSTVLARNTDPSLHQSGMLVNESVEVKDDDDNDDDEEDVETILLDDEQNDGRIVNAGNCDDDPMFLDEPRPESRHNAPDSVTNTWPGSPPQHSLGMFGLRHRDQVSFDMTYSSSGDELTRVITPRSVSPAKGGFTGPVASGFGFTPLARRFDSWKASSPLKNEIAFRTPEAATSPESRVEASGAQEPPMKNTFFEDEMSVRPDLVADDSVNGVDTRASAAAAGVPEIKDPVCDKIPITAENVAVAAETSDMAMMSSEKANSMLNLDGPDGSVSEASQEYGDENETPHGHWPIDTPAAHVTPQRLLIRREVHTTSKVPLKAAADESTPPAQPDLNGQRRHSVCRFPQARPTYSLTRSATVISYSPPHGTHVDPAFEEAAEAEEEESHSRAGSVPPVTIPQTESWPDAATPARTGGHGDVDAAILRGSVVFVDVHTMEGADASAIFVELLIQMGARCVKNWTWNAEDGDPITHVVYKDGGKQTLDRVRETGGAVQCVGVAWVLDCERENKWLDEGPYYVDTSTIPRRRRRRMTLMVESQPDPAINSRAWARGCQTVPATPVPANRRQSSLWVHSPHSYREACDVAANMERGQDLYHGDDEDWLNLAPLTPLPKTPAPEAIHRFAMEGWSAGEGVPTTKQDEEEEDEDEYDYGNDEGGAALSREQLIQRTCPPKAHQRYPNLGAGILGLDKDQAVARRLMDARRKSLAFAPKISSPLAKCWM